MFLIQYGLGKFVNANNISWVDFSDGCTFFGLLGDVGCAIKVEVEFNSVFCNHLQALNSNITNIEVYSRELRPRASSSSSSKQSISLSDITL